MINENAPRSVVPFGPQHPVLPEPIHIKLVLEDEKIVEATPAIGYVHRGLEKLTEKKDMFKSIFVLERICGICSFMHAQCYCQGLENLMEIDIPERAKYLRVIWGELHRTHSHLLWLGLFADAFGFESLFYECWRIREKILDIMEATSGARVIISTNTIGGTRRDISSEMLEHIKKTTYEIEEAVDYIEKVFIEDTTVLTRTKDVGYLSKSDAYLLGAVGPTGRGSGLPQDLRTTGYAAYSELDFEPVVELGGDCDARCKVRIKEIYQSQRLLRQAIEKIPEGDFAVKVTKKPQGDTVSRIEQPRGECMYFIRGNGTDILERVRVRTPTFANIPALVKMLPGHNLYDLPVLILSIDPCISCTER